MKLSTDLLGISGETETTIVYSQRPQRGLIGPAASRGFLALADQAVVSGARFLITIFVARACGPHELGLYSLAFTVVMLVASIQESLISLPYTIFGARLEGDERRIYAGSALMRCICLAAMVSGVVALAAEWSAAGVGPAGLAPVLWALTVAVPVLFLVEFARRFYFAHLRMDVALILDVCVALLQLGALAAVLWYGRLSATTAYLAIAVACTVATVLWFVLSRSRFHIAPRAVGKSIGRDWRFGRWVFASQFTAAVRSSVVHWLLAMLLSAAATGLFAACATIVQLANPLLLGIGNFLTPSIADALARGGLAKVRHVVITATCILTIAVVLLGGLMIGFGDDLLAAFYGQQYTGQQMTLALLVLGMIVEAIGLPAYNGLWALERPSVNFFCMAVGLVVTVAVACVLVMPLGTVGAACGVLAGRAIATLLQSLAFLRLSTTSAVELAAEPA